MDSTNHQRWASVRPQQAWKHPGLPRDWCRVLNQHPSGDKALDGYVWLSQPQRRHLTLRARHLEFTFDLADHPEDR